jgi:hypothetical protein
MRIVPKEKRVRPAEPFVDSDKYRVVDLSKFDQGVLPRPETKDGDIQLENTLESREKNYQVVKAMNGKRNLFVQKKYSPFPSEDRDWAIRNAELALLWLAHFYPESYGNSETKISEASFVSLFRLNFLVMRPPPLVSLNKVDEPELRKRLTESTDSWNIEKWEAVMRQLEHDYADAISRMDDSEEKNSKIEQLTAWQFTIHSQLAIIKNRGVSKEQPDRQKFRELMGNYMSKQESNSLFTTFITTLHRGLLSVCPQERFQQNDRHTGRVAEIPNVWTTVDEEFGRAAHEGINAMNVRDFWEKKDYRFRDLYDLAVISEYCQEHYRANLTDDFVVLPFDYSKKYRWLFQKTRNLRPRSPIIARLLDGWYVAVGCSELVYCSNTVDAFLVWCSRLGNTTDTGVSLRLCF